MEPRRRIPDLHISLVAIVCETPDDHHQADGRYRRVKSFVGTVADAADQCGAWRSQCGERVNTEKENEAYDQYCHHRLRINKAAQDIALLQLLGRTVVTPVCRLEGAGGECDSPPIFGRCRSL